jgi:hypothetical protein
VTRLGLELSIKKENMGPRFSPALVHAWLIASELINRDTVARRDAGDESIERPIRIRSNEDAAGWN